MSSRIARFAARLNWCNPEYAHLVREEMRLESMIAALRIPHELEWVGELTLRHDLTLRCRKQRSEVRLMQSEFKAKQSIWRRKTSNGI